LGPCTNLALAIRLDETIIPLIRSITIMGGSYLGKGNASMGAEFNFFADPEGKQTTILMYHKQYVSFHYIGIFLCD
jgi:inosine-uridine nucleoside N-ribohydrolase